MLGSPPKELNLVSIGLSILAALLIIVFSVALYDSLFGEDNKTILGDPELVAVAVGLILSVLFVERWRSLEARVERLSEAQQSTFQNIQSFAKEHLEHKVENIISKAESLNASVAGIVARHPWLEVVTDREMIIETDSCRGILRTSYALLRSDRILHLFEFLEYCSRKGSARDPRETKTSLCGTADDFYELCLFCEVWLRDYYLGSQFLQRFIEQYPASAYLVLPDYIRRLLRIGDVEGAERYARNLKRRVFGQTVLHSWLLAWGVRPQVSAKSQWLAANTLALVAATFSDSRSLRKYLRRVKTGGIEKGYPIKQVIFDAELAIQLGNFDGAAAALSNLDERDLSAEDLSEVGMLFSKLGFIERAEAAFSRALSRRRNAFGDTALHSDRPTASPASADVTTSTSELTGKDIGIEQVPYEAAVEQHAEPVTSHGDAELHVSPASAGGVTTSTSELTGKDIDTERVPYEAAAVEQQAEPVTLLGDAELHSSMPTASSGSTDAVASTSGLTEVDIGIERLPYEGAVGQQADPVLFPEPQPDTREVSGIGVSQADLQNARPESGLEAQLTEASVTPSPEVDVLPDGTGRSAG